MSVIKRLSRLTGEAERPESPSRREETAELRRRIERILSRRPPPGRHSDTVPRRRESALGEVISGAEASTVHGSCFVSESLLDHAFCHGNRPIEALSRVDMDAASLLANDRLLAGRALTEGLFLDTETTGLAGGSGTFIFLIGLGWFEKGGFATRQIFLRDFAEERAALSLLSALAENKKFLVSFNGKSFDVGLLSTRYVMNRLHNPLGGMPHLDLLYPARRLVGHRLENCRLSTLEERVLGFFRRGDVPGSEIPQRYFDWLRRRDASLVADIFEHNRLDVLSLASLMAHLTELLDVRPGGSPADHRDILSAARLAVERKEDGKARRLLETLAASGSPAPVREARKLLSLRHKRSGQWGNAVELWERMIRDDAGDLFALIELAKRHEHGTREYRRAHDLALRALDHAGDGPERKALAHRLRRLQRRMAAGDRDAGTVRLTKDEQ